MVTDTISVNTIESRGLGCIVGEVLEGAIFGVFGCFQIFDVPDELICVPAIPISATIGMVVQATRASQDCKNKDCGTPSSITSGGNATTPCGTTRTYRINGAGEGAIEYQWNVVNGIPATATTSVPYLEVTPINPDERVIVSAGPVCATVEGTMGNPDIKEWSPLNNVDFDVLDLANTVSPLMLTSNSGNSNAQVGDITTFLIYGDGSSVTNQSITSISMSPQIGGITDNGDGSFDVNWFMAGTTTITVVKTNSCSNATTTATMTYVVSN